MHLNPAFADEETKSPKVLKSLTMIITLAERGSS